MTETLEIVGHLNRFGREVTPIATDAIFRRRGTLFLSRPHGEVPLSEEEVLSYEAEDFVHWLAPIRVASTSGRLLLHENLEGVQGGSQPSLTYSFLSWEEEFALCTELAVAYLAQAGH